MDSRSVNELYDEAYAEAYDQRFLLDAWPKHGAEVELGIIRTLLSTGGRWLDVGCGTGWFLSRFPEVERAGFDLSPAMVARATAANPTALFIEERSFLDSCPAWNGHWDLVTCMWQPYNYVDSVWQVEQLLDNLAAWTRPGGALFLPVLDLEDIRPHVVVPYEIEPDVWGGTISLTSITWTWREAGTGKVHAHLVAPQAEHFVRYLSSSFRKIEVIRYPPFEKGGVARKAVLATERRGVDDDRRSANVVWHARPAHLDELAEKMMVVAHQRAHLEASAGGTDGDGRPRSPQPTIPPELAAELEENERRWAENNQRWAENAEAWSENRRVEFVILQEDKE